MTSLTFDALVYREDPANPSLNARVTIAIDGNGSSWAFAPLDPTNGQSVTVQPFPMLSVNGSLATVYASTWARWDYNGASTIALAVHYSTADGDTGVLFLQADGTPLTFENNAEMLDFLRYSQVSLIDSGPWAGGEGAAVPLADFMDFRSQSQTDVVAFTYIAAQDIDFTPPFAFDAGLGNDRITGSAWYDSFLGGDGHDLIQLGDNPGDAGAKLSKAYFNPWWETLGPDAFNWDDRGYGGAGNDTISAGTGNAWMDGGAGNDVLTGGTGRDSAGTSYRFTALGGDGKDIITAASAGSSTLDGGAGNDTLTAEASFTALKKQGIAPDGTITIFGGAGNDLITGSINKLDSLSGGEGNDTIRALDGGDALSGDGGHDWIDGGAGNDTAYGGVGNDQIFGGTGNDWLYGDAGADLLSGGEGIDRLEGGAGNDTLQGGAGADAFSFLPGMNRDVVSDFSMAEGDSLRISRTLTGNYKTSADVVGHFASVIDGNTVLNFGAGNTLTLQGLTDLSDLGAHITLI